jgi:hypothetical protein
MDLENILKQLRDKRDQLDVTIRALELAAIGAPKRRGRPPKWMTQAASVQSAAGPERVPPSRKKRPAPHEK